MAETPSQHTGDLIGRDKTSQPLPFAHRPRWPIAVAAAGLFVVAIVSIALRLRERAEAPRPQAHTAATATSAGTAAVTPNGAEGDLRPRTIAPPAQADPAAASALDGTPNPAAATAAAPNTAGADENALSAAQGQDAIAVSVSSDASAEPGRPTPLRPRSARFMPLPPNEAATPAPADLP